ncbi:MAG: cyclic nucleotide-binding domain-containing protein, partial [Bdellovibrionota bacterium]
MPTKPKPKSRTFSAGSVLFNEGEKGDFFYFVDQGCVGIYRRYESDRTPLAIIGKNQAVGDLAVLDRRARSATAVALTNVTVFKIMRAEVVEQLLLCPLWFSTIIHLLVERLRSANEIVARNRIRDSELTEMIEKVLADGDSAFVRPVNEMQPFPVVEPEGSVEFRRGDIVLNEGDPGGFFYFIRSGKLGVFKDYHGDRIPLAQLKRLQVVGEMAVVDGKSRCATTVALTDVDLMRITKKGFDHQLNQHKSWFKALIQTTVERLRHTNAIIERSKVRDSELVALMHDVYVDTVFRSKEKEPRKLAAGRTLSTEADKPLITVASSRIPLLDMDGVVVKGKAVRETDNKKFVVQAKNDAGTKKAKTVRVDSNQTAALIVDPESGFVQSVTDLLEDAGIKVVSCGTSDQALVKVKNQKFCCMVINLNLKRGKAVHLIRRIRYIETTSGNRMPIFILATKADAKAILPL